MTEDKTTSLIWDTKIDGTALIIVSVFVILTLLEFKVFHLITEQYRLMNWGWVGINLLIALLLGIAFYISKRIKNDNN